VELFTRWPSLEASGFVAKQGIGTSDNFRFLRLRWEIPSNSTERWWSYSKGGSYAPFFVESDLVLNWAFAGSEVKAYSAKLYGTWSKQITNTHYFGEPGLTYASRTHRELGAALQPSRSAFDTKGCCIFSAKKLERKEWFALLGVMNSRMFAGLLRVGLARAISGLARQYTESLVIAMPLPQISNLDGFAQLIGKAYSLHERIDSVNETATLFNPEPFLAVLSASRPIDVIEGLRKQFRQEWESQLELASSIDSAVCAAYFDGQVLPELIARYLASEVGAIPSQVSQVSEQGFWNPIRESSLFLPMENLAVETMRLAQLSLSALVGVISGKWGCKYKTGALWQKIIEYRERKAGILFVDDEGGPLDLMAELEEMFPESALELTRESLRDLGRLATERGLELREYFAREFFALHLRTFSADKRRAPIYWQLSTPSTSYSVWLYIHDFTKDTLFRVQHDYVECKLAHEERQLETLRAEAGPDPVTSQRKAIEAQEAFVEELRAFHDEVKRVAPLWNPNLDDGVMINFAPLWRLVPHHKPWQKELKSTWDALCAGKYDWAHLAMHLWPERVVPKCAEDRSFAIAHELEDVFWYQDEDEKWKPRDEPTTPIEALVTERTSPAVKAALESLREAPEQSGSTRRGRGRR
jgi:hypothetical protein